MKLLNQEHRVVNLDDNFDTNKFGITMGPKMFHILSDGLYSDKILACIRELSTNALDSHKANGNENEPFDVCLPTWNKPEFYIRDYGTGMSKETVQRVFSMYGASSKDDSNLFTGCLGLGSKTPFSYHTRTFTITSWYNGSKYDYRCNIGKDGIPELSLISEIRSSERSGVKISFPTINGDENRFIERAKKVYKYFTVKPNFIGNKITIENVKYSFKGTDWAIRAEKSSYGNQVNGARLIMGSIAYPITTDNIPAKYHTLCNGYVDIFANIGDVSIEVSREGLQYDALTINYIVNKMNDVIREATSKLMDGVNLCKSMWEARQNVIAIYNSIDESLRSYIDFSLVKFNNEQVYTDTYFRIKLSNSFRTFYKHSKGYYRKTTVIRDEEVDTVKADYGLYYNDLKTGAVLRCRKLIEDGTYERVMLFDWTDPAKKAATLKDLGMPDDKWILPISSVVHNRPTIVRAKRGKTSTGMVWNPDENYVTKQWTNTMLDLTSPGVYVQVDNYNFTGSVFQNSELSRVIKLLRVYNVSINQVFGVKTKVIDTVVKTPNWIKVDDYFKDLMYNSCLNLKKVISADYWNHSYYEKVLYQCSDLYPLYRKCNDDVNYIRSSLTYSDAQSANRLYESYCSLYKTTIPEVELERSTLKTHLSNIYRHYPLLKNCADNHETNYKQLKSGLTHYMGLVNNS